LKTGLVHWQTVTLLSQRLAVLSGQGLVERKGGRGKNFLKITDVGVSRIKGVFESYDNLGKHVLDGVSPADRDTHFRINNLIRSNLDPAWACTQAARGMPGA
jgi:DNA-binding MarR family transcriptional regulator